MSRSLGQPVQSNKPRNNDPPSDDKYNCAHSTYDSDTVHLSAEQQEDNIPDREPAEIESSDNELVVIPLAI